jgi:hypothetical protein
VLRKLSNEDAVRSGKGPEIEAPFDLDVDLKYGDVSEREGREGMGARVGGGVETVPRTKGPEIVRCEAGAVWEGLRVRLMRRFRPFAFSFSGVGVLHSTSLISTSISISIPVSIESEPTPSR